MVRYLFAVLVMSMLLVGCESTKVVQSWKDPSVSGPLRFKKILVIFNHPDAFTRHVAEDELVNQIGRDRAVAADTVLSEAERGNIELIKAKVMQAGFDGVVALRLAGAVTRTSATPPVNPYSYDSFWQDQDRNTLAADRSEGSVQTERVISIRTRIYSVGDQKLVWEGYTESVNPHDLRQGIAEIAKAVGKKLRAEHLIQ